MLRKFLHAVLWVFLLVVFPLNAGAAQRKESKLFIPTHITTLLIAGKSSFPNSWFDQQNDAPAIHFGALSLTSAPEIGTSYRWTKNGWEDSSKWRNYSYSVSPLLDAIHPLIWAGLMLALALFFLFGFSSQEEIDELFVDLNNALSILDKSAALDSAPDSRLEN
jgi:hypothetical protein